LWDRHILNSVAIAELIPIDARLVDVGSGAGLPGLALACVRPDLTVDLVEPLLRRTEFLAEVVADLALQGRVRVVRGRAEDGVVQGAVGGARFVTARAVASLDKLARWTFPLLLAGGSLLAIKGATAEAEVATHSAVLRRLGAGRLTIRTCGEDWLTPPVRVVDVQRA
jgi:16S rRNA (guanine527-N7)-methyltransferase